jgi:hypothetical protein
MPTTKKNSILSRLATRASSAAASVPSATTTAVAMAVTAPSVAQQAIDLRLFLVETGRLATESTAPAEGPIPETLLLSLRGRLQRHPREKFLSSLEQMPSLDALRQCLALVLAHPEDAPADRVLEFIATLAASSGTTGEEILGVPSHVTVDSWKEKILATWSAGLCKGLPTMDAARHHLDTLSFTDLLVLGAIKNIDLSTIQTAAALEKKFKEIIEMPSAMRGAWNHCIFYNIFHASLMPQNLSALRIATQEAPVPELHFPLTTLKAYVTECFFYTSAAQEISTFCRRHAWDYLREALTRAREDAISSGNDPSTVVLHEQYLRKLPKHFLATLPDLVWTLRTLDEWDAFLGYLENAMVTHPEMIEHLIRKVLHAAPRTNFLLGNLQDFLLSVRHPITKITTRYKEKDMGMVEKVTVIDRRGFRRMGVEELLAVIRESPDLLAAYEAAGYSTDLQGKARPRHRVHAAPSRIRAYEVPPERKRSLLRTQPWLRDLCVRDLLLRVMEADGGEALESPAYVIDPRMPSYVLPEDQRPVFRVSDRFLDSFFTARDEIMETPQLVFHTSTGLLETTAGIHARVFFQLVNGDIVPMTYDHYLKQGKFFQEMEVCAMAQGVATLRTETKTDVSSRWRETPVLEVNMDWMQTIRQKQIDSFRGVLACSKMLPSGYAWDLRALATEMEAHHFHDNPSLHEYLKRGEKVVLLFDRFSKLSPLLVIFHKRVQLGALFLERLGTAPWTILLPEIMVLEPVFRDKVLVMIDALVDAGVERVLTSLLAVTLFPELLSERKRTRSTTATDAAVLPIDYPTDIVASLTQKLQVPSYASLVWDDDGAVYNATDPRLPKALLKKIQPYLDLNVLEDVLESSSTGTLFFSEMMRYLIPSTSTSCSIATEDVPGGETTAAVPGSTPFLPGLEDLILESILTL